MVKQKNMKTKHLLTFMLLTLSVLRSNNATAQNFSLEKQAQLDSLNLIINTPTSHDTAIASAYVELSEILYVSNIDTVIYLCKITEKIAGKGLQTTTNKAKIASYKKSLADVANNIGMIFNTWKGN
jgi:hypothetical protein